MSFLSPALFGVLIPLAALPVVIHLLNKGFPRRFQFPSVELIKATLARRSRVHRWRHWILLLLRTVFLLLLLLAFLQPMLPRFGSNPADQNRRQVLIIFDHSVSMECRGDGPTSRERALHEASKLIDSLDPDDTVNVLLMEPNPTTCFVDFSRDHAEAKRFLTRLKPGLGRADVNLANTAAARLIAKTAARPEIYYLSDFQRKNWANADFTALPPSVKLFFVDVGPVRRDNRAILDAHLMQAQVLAGDTAMLEVTVGNFSSEPFNDRVTVMLDKRYSVDQKVAIAPWSEGKVLVPVPVGGPGVHLCEASLPPDALEYDNHYHLTITAQEKEEVLIVTDGPDDRKSAAYFLKTALNPFENAAGSLLPQVISSGELTPDRLAGVHKMFFTGLNRMTPEACSAVGQFLFQGGGLIYFLDGPVDPENLAALEKVIGPEPDAAAPVPAAGGDQCRRRGAANRLGRFQITVFETLCGHGAPEPVAAGILRLLSGGRHRRGRGVAGLRRQFTGHGFPALRTGHDAAAEFFRRRTFQQLGAPAAFSRVDAGPGQGGFRG